MANDTYHKYQVRHEQTGRGTKGVSHYGGYAEPGDEVVAAAGLAPTDDDKQSAGYKREDYPLWDRLEVVEEDVDADSAGDDVPFAGALPSDDDERDERRSLNAGDVLSRRDKTMKGRGVSEEEAENRDLDESAGDYDASNQRENDGDGDGDGESGN